MSPKDPRNVQVPQHVDSAMSALAASADRLRAKRGMSRRQLAIAAEIEVTHMSHFLNGKKGLSVDALSRVARALGGVLAVDEVDAATSPVGTIDREGILHLEGELSLPALFEVTGAFGPFAAGDRVTIYPSDKWELDRYLIVESSGRRRLAKAIDQDGLRGLLMSDGDVVVYQPSRHIIVGRATSRTPATEVL